MGLSVSACHYNIICQGRPSLMEQKKTCRGCGGEFPLTEFPLDKNRPGPRCKDCRAAYRWYAQRIRCAGGKPKGLREVDMEKIRQDWEAARKEWTEKTAANAKVNEERARRVEEKKRLLAEGKRCCSVCGEVKPLEAFPLSKSCLGGHTARCKACRAIYRQEYYAANRERLIQRAAQWQRDNPERVAERQRDYCSKNRERVNARAREYYHKNREKIRAQQQEYYRKKRL